MSTEGNPCVRPSVRPQVSVEYAVAGDQDPYEGVGQRTKVPVGVFMQEGARAHRFAQGAGLSPPELAFIRDVVQSRVGGGGGGGGRRGGFLPGAEGEDSR